MLSEKIYKNFAYGANSAPARSTGAGMCAIMAPYGGGSAPSPEENTEERA